MKTKDKGGRPAHVPDDRSRQMVEVLSGFGIPQDKIADVIGVDGKTLRKHYTTELQRGAATVEARRLAYLQCPRCGGVIEEKHKFEMNARGGYVAPGQQINPDGHVIGDPPESTTISFWVSGLASPFVSFGERAGRYVEALNSGDQEEVQTVINGGSASCGRPPAVMRRNGPTWRG